MHDQEVSLAGVLERLQVPRNAVLFVHASAKWLLSAGITPESALKDLYSHCGRQGTIVMPSFPFVGAHLDYMRQKPIFDVSRTPARIGLLYEVFRRGNGVCRGLAPDLPLAARGYNSKDIILPESSFEELDPTGGATAFRRILEVDAHLVGLGVTENTNVFIHHIDSLHQDRYPGPVLAEEVNEAISRDPDGTERLVRRRSFLPIVQKVIKPNKISALCAPEGAYSSEKIGETVFFRWKLSDWVGAALREIDQSEREHRWPLWLEGLDGAYRS